MTDQSVAPSNRFELHLRIRLAPGRRHDFLAFLSETIPFYEAPGGIRIRLLQNEDAPDDFIEIVEYENRETYERDQVRVASDPAMNERLVRWRALLAGAATVEVYRVFEIVHPTVSPGSPIPGATGGEPP